MFRVLLVLIALTTLCDGRGVGMAPKLSSTGSRSPPIPGKIHTTSRVSTAPRVTEPSRPVISSLHPNLQLTLAGQIAEGFNLTADERTQLSQPTVIAKLARLTPEQVNYMFGMQTFTSILQMLQTASFQDIVQQFPEQRAEFLFNQSKNACQPYTCYNSRITTDATFIPGMGLFVYVQKSIEGGKWLKFETTQFQPDLADDKQFVNVSKIIQPRPNEPALMNFTVPAMLRFDPPVNEAMLYQRYMKIMNNKTKVLDKAYADVVAGKITGFQFNQTLTSENKKTNDAYYEYLRSFKATLYSYMHPDFQKNSTNPAKVVKTLPALPANSTATVITAPTTLVHALNHPNYGLTSEFEIARAFFQKQFEKPIGVFYVANYANGYNDILICKDQTKPKCI